MYIERMLMALSQQQLTLAWPVCDRLHPSWSIELHLQWILLFVLIDCQYAASTSLYALSEDSETAKQCDRQ